MLSMRSDGTVKEKERDGNGWDEIEKGKKRSAGILASKLGQLSRSNWQENENEIGCRCLSIQGGSLFWCEQGRQSFD
jgi:hypothetical protein